MQSKTAQQTLTATAVKPKAERLDAVIKRLEKALDAVFSHAECPHEISQAISRLEGVLIDEGYMEPFPESVGS